MKTKQLPLSLVVMAVGQIFATISCNRRDGGTTYQCTVRVPNSNKVHEMALANFTLTEALDEVLDSLVMAGWEVDDGGKHNPEDSPVG